MNNIKPNKMKISNNYFLVILTLIMACTFTACSQSEPIIEQEPTIYDGCCGTEPKIIQVEDLIVYIPNVIIALTTRSVRDKE